MSLTLGRNLVVSSTSSSSDPVEPRCPGGDPVDDELLDVREQSTIVSVVTELPGMLAEPPSPVTDPPLDPRRPPGELVEPRCPGGDPVDLLCRGGGPGSTWGR